MKDVQEEIDLQSLVNDAMAEFQDTSGDGKAERARTSGGKTASAGEERRRLRRTDYGEADKGLVIHDRQDFALSDEIKQIAALIGHHQALEKRVTSLTEQFQAASSQLQQQSETLSRVIRELDSASGNMTDTVRKSVSSLTQVEKELKQAGLTAETGDRSAESGCRYGESDDP